MRIGIHTWGSEGDIRPFLALASGLALAGHEVQLVHSSLDGTDYTASSTDVVYEHRLIVSSQTASERYRVAEEIFADASPLRQLSRVMRELLEPVIDDLTQSACELAKWADVLVLHPFAHPLSAAAEAARKPFVCVCPGSMVPTREFPPPGLPHLGVLNSLTWKLWLALLSASCLDSFNRVRVRLGLEPLRHSKQQFDRSTLDLVAMSPTLLSRPKDWPEKVHLSGFLSAPPAARKERLDPELRAFLAQGPPPVFVSFDSISAVERNPSTLIEQTEEAVEAAGYRAIVHTELPKHHSPNVLRVAMVAPDQVLPHCSVMIHHGGAETTAAAVLAGRPSVVLAHVPAHFMWGRQLHKLGVAPRHLSRGEFDTKHLTRAIEKATRDPAMRAAAERLGLQMRRENGVQRAVELITGIAI